MTTRIATLTMVAGSIVQVIGYAIDSAAPPFPAFVLAFALNGFGLALQVNRVSTSSIALLDTQPGRRREWVCRKLEGQCSDQDGHSSRCIRSAPPLMLLLPEFSCSSLSQALAPYVRLYRPPRLLKCSTGRTST